MGDMAAKREEFMHWLKEIKSLNIDALTRTQEKKFLKSILKNITLARSLQKNTII